MRFWPLTKRKTPLRSVTGTFEELEEQVHRLEIAVRQLRERYDDLDGRHSSLSAQIRGRMGGRPPKNQGSLVGIVPVGAQHLFNQQER